MRRVIVDKQGIDALIEGDISLERFRESFERMNAGKYCFHRTFGIGQLKSYDAATKRLLIEFENGETRAMDPVFCIKKLEMLDDSDLLVQFSKSPDEIRQKLKKSSVALLTEYLSNMPNKRASLGDIERTFGKIVEGKNFKRWWNVTKKLISKEPTLTIEEGNVTYVKLCDQPISEEEDLLQKFMMAREIPKKINFAERFLTIAKANPDAKQYAEKVVHELTKLGQVKTRKVTPSERFQICVVRGDLAKIAGIDTDAITPKLETLMAEYSNLGKVCDALSPAYYHIFLEFVTRVFPDEWEKLCFGILKNCNERLANECITYLKDSGHANDVRTTLAKWLEEKSLRAPLLQWIIKNRHAKKFEEVFSPELMCGELLRAILWAIDNEALAGSGKLRKIPLAELLNNDKSLIHDLLSSSDEDTASDLAQTLLINQGIDNLSKKSLFARFIATFPSVQDLLLKANKTKVPQDISLKVSLSSLEAKKKEYDILVKEKIPSNKKAIEIAREQGDLSENSEYKMARQDQETLLSRKAQLEEELRVAQVVDFSNVDTSMVSIGSVVTLKQVESDETVDYTILGAWDSDPSKNIISYKTALAQSLLGKKKDDVVSMSDINKENWQIEAIRPYVAAQ